MAIQSLNSTYATVIRGWGSTRADPPSGATVYFIPAATATLGYIPYGSCTRANLPYVPVVVDGDQDMTNNGLTLDCLGSVWTPTNQAMWPVFGATVASATTIGPTGNYFKVSGTTNDRDDHGPGRLGPGHDAELEPTGLWSTTTAGNILLATTGVVSQGADMTWNGTKWVPSY
jgi:hypothetical protein